MLGTRPVPIRPVLYTSTAACFLLLATATWAGGPGSLDPGFGVGGKVTSGFGLPAGFDQGYAVALQLDGKALIAGNATFMDTDYDFGVLRLTAAGALDLSFAGTGMSTVFFDLEPGGQDQACAVAVGPDGTIVVAGSASLPTRADIAVAKLLPDGTLDPSFDGDGKAVIPFDPSVPDSTDVSLAQAVVVQPDGKILVGGVGFSNANNGDCFVVRLNADGSLDSGFGVGGRLSLGEASSEEWCIDLELQDDGKVVLLVEGGSVTDSAVVRLTATGALDETFDGDGVMPLDFGPAQSEPAALEIDASGRLVVAGFVDLPPGRGGGGSPGEKIGVFRLLPSGALDASFGSGGWATFEIDDSVRLRPTSLGVGEGGRVVVGGIIDGLGYEAWDFLAVRFLADGTVDSSFGLGGFSTVPFDLAPHNDDRVADLVLRANGDILLAGTAFSEIVTSSLVAAAQLDGSVPLFQDGFESGDTSLWSVTVP